MAGTPRQPQWVDAHPTEPIHTILPITHHRGEWEIAGRDRQKPKKTHQMSTSPENQNGNLQHFPMAHVPVTHFWWAFVGTSQTPANREER